MKTIDGKLFKQMVVCGANHLQNYYAEIDALNVFPVPDGDTGTNMSLTFTNGAKDVAEMDSDSIAEIAKKLSRGLLMGARGNSGVILSQIFRGFSMGLEGRSEVDSVQMAHALKKGSEVAYKAVMRPVEGTILTVIREAAEDAMAYVQPDMDMEELFSYFVDRAQVSLDHTPELLPVLKEVGVVDSGGAGLVTILTGFVSGLNGEVVHLVDRSNEEAIVEEVAEPTTGYNVDAVLMLEDRKAKSFTTERLVKELENIPADFVSVVQNGSEITIHAHTSKPGNVLNLSQRFGEFKSISAKNIAVKEEDLAPAKKERTELALISVAAGEGVQQMFKDLRASVVNGGQTMNPSAEDIVAAIREANAEHVIILPNNSNIVMTAQQAAIILEGEVDVRVIPSKSIPQGLSACIMFNPDEQIDTNIADMTDAVANVKTGQITFAIKDTNIDGVDIRANDYMALVEKKIIACIPDKHEALKAALEALITEDDEIVTLIAGEDVSTEELEAAAAYIEDNYDVEVDAHEGKQQVYSYIIGVE